MAKTAFGLVKSEDQALNILERCRREGASAENTSILIADRQNKLTRLNNGTLEPTTEYQSRWRGAFGRSDKVVGHEKHSKAPEGAATGGVLGGAVGGTIGLLAGLGAIAIPGLGAFVAAGPILAALSGSAVGGSLGLAVGALAGLGVPEYEAKKFEKGLQEGQILIAVEANDNQQLKRCEQCMKDGGAENVSCV